MAIVTKIASRLRRVGLYLIDDVTIPTYLTVFVVVVTVSGILYHCLTPFGHGIGRDSSPLSDTSFSNGLHLSLVTVSSLGYSDMHPIGFSKAVASLEALAGMALTGILIAKITSRKLSFHVSRIYGSYTQAVLDNMAGSFEHIVADLRFWGSQYTANYQGFLSREDTNIKSEMIRDLEGIVKNLESQSKLLNEYVIREVSESDYFQNAPTDSIMRLARSLEEVFSIFGQILMNVSMQARIEILQMSVKVKISNATWGILGISNIVHQHRRASEMPDVQGAFERIGRVCSVLLGNLGESPEKPQPNQIDRAMNDPSPVEGPSDESARMR